MPDGSLLANKGRKSERGLHTSSVFETTAMAGCLVDIQASGYGLLLLYLLNGLSENSKQIILV